MKESQVTAGMIDAFLSDLEVQGKLRPSIDAYGRTLKRWYKSLPEDKMVAEDASVRWAATLREEGVADANISTYVSIVNRFLKYLGYPITIRERIPYEQKKEKELKRILTRKEYQFLLHGAKEKGYRRAYLLIKTIGGLGIRNTEVQDLTVDSVKQGEITLTAWGVTRTVKIYEPIRSDLLAYAAERGIESGAIFITKEGKGIQHFFVWKEIKKVCRQIGMPEDKGTPVTLYNMYHEIKRTLPAKSVEEVDLKYQALLQEEEVLVGWDSVEEQKVSVEERESQPAANIVVRTKGKRLSSEEKYHLAYKIGEALPKTLTSQYDCEVTIVFKRKEDADTSQTNS
jgi:site-specific recombinase XerD